jgi:hypothetical protein
MNNHVVDNNDDNDDDDDDDDYDYDDDDDGDDGSRCGSQDDDNQYHSDTDMKALVRRRSLSCGGGSWGRTWEGLQAAAGDPVGY